MQRRLESLRNRHFGQSRLERVDSEPHAPIRVKRSGCLCRVVPDRCVRDPFATGRLVIVGCEAGPVDPVAVQVATVDLMATVDLVAIVDLVANAVEPAGRPS